MGLMATYLIYHLTSVQKPQVKEQNNEGDEEGDDVYDDDYPEDEEGPTEGQTEGDYGAAAPGSGAGDHSVDGDPTLPAVQSGALPSSPGGEASKAPDAEAGTMEAAVDSEVAAGEVASAVPPVDDTPTAVGAAGDN